MAAKNPQHFLEQAAEATPPFTDMIGLRKAGQTFVEQLIKKLGSGRTSKVKRCRAILDCDKTDSVIQEKARTAIDNWDEKEKRFTQLGLEANLWTAADGPSNASVMLNYVCELDAANDMCVGVLEKYTRSKNNFSKQSARAKRESQKASVNAVRPFLLNGIDGGWKHALLFLDLVYVDPAIETSYKPSKDSADENRSLDWSAPQWWYGAKELEEKHHGQQLKCAQAMFRQCSDSVRTSMARTWFRQCPPTRQCSDNVQTMFRYCPDIVQTMSRQWSDNVQTPLRHCTA